MGREVRMVPPDWEHPRYPGTYSDGSPRYRGLLSSSYAETLREWIEGKAKWDAGLKPDFSQAGAYKLLDTNDKRSWEEYWGERPDPSDYMPDFPEGTATHFMMYETCTEGTPISPAFADPKRLAHWLADTNASAFGHEGASYEHWLATIKRGWAVSAVLDSSGIHSGVEAMADKD